MCLDWNEILLRDYIWSGFWWHLDTEWSHCPLGELSASCDVGCSRCKDAHFIRQWMDHEKPSLPFLFVCDAHAWSPGSYKNPRHSEDGPRQTLIMQTKCMESPHRSTQPSLSAVSIGTLDIQSGLYLIGRKKLHQLRPNLLFITLKWRRWEPINFLKSCKFLGLTSHTNKNGPPQVHQRSLQSPEGPHQPRNQEYALSASHRPGGPRTPFLPSLHGSHLHLHPEVCSLPG